MRNMRKVWFLAAICLLEFMVHGCVGSDPVNNSNTPDDAASNGFNDISANGFSDISASELVENIKVGWNLGNTLDCFNGWWTDPNPTVSRMETAWGNPVTTQAIFDLLKSTGFNAVRIPVTWTKTVDSDYIIRADWMARVIEVVNYAVKSDLYIILNTHHDDGGEGIFKFTPAEEAQSLRAFGIIWAQIAAAFKDYSEKLVFEAMNEPRTEGSAWGGTPEQRASINRHYQLFVDTVRASGGHNDKRILMVDTCWGASSRAALNALEIPKDTVEGKIIVSYHSYAPIALAETENNVTAFTGRGDVNEAINAGNDIFVKKGIPVIIGEFGTVNKNNEAARAEHAEYFTSRARQYGIPCFWWDNGGSGNTSYRLLDRQTNTFLFPQIIAGIMRGAGVTVNN